MGPPQRAQLDVFQSEQRVIKILIYQNTLLYFVTYVFAITYLFIILLQVQKCNRPITAVTKGK